MVYKVCLCLSVSLKDKAPLQMASNSRKTSIVEAAEQHFDKNTVILIINLVILTVLMGLLYMVATSAMAVGGKDEN